jgi:hypothetical protein
MKLSFPQKTAITLALLWSAWCIPVILFLTTWANAVSDTYGAIWFVKAIIFYGSFLIVPPVFILWISGTLNPLRQWFRES